MKVRKLARLAWCYLSPHKYLLLLWLAAAVLFVVFLGTRNRYPYPAEPVEASGRHRTGISANFGFRVLRPVAGPRNFSGG